MTRSEHRLWIMGAGLVLLGIIHAGAAAAQSRSAAVFQALANVDASGAGTPVCGDAGNQAIGGDGNRLIDTLNTVLGTPGFDDTSVGVAQRRAAFRLCDSFSPTGAGGWTGNGGLDPGGELATATAFAPEEIFAGMDNANASFGLQTANVTRRLSLVRLARRTDRRANERIAARERQRTRGFASDPSEVDPEALYTGRNGFARRDRAERADRVYLALQEGINAGDGSEESGLGFFLNGRVNVVKGEQNISEGGSEGFGGGFTLGLDHAIGDNLFGGIAMGYTHIKTNFDGSASDSELDAVTFTGYGAFYPTDNLYLDGSFSVSYLGFEQSNEIIIFDGGPPPSGLDGDTDGANVGFDVGIGYAFMLTDGEGDLVTGLSIEPFMRWSLLYTSIDEFDLKGGDGTLDLSIEEQETLSVTVNLGFRVDYPMSTRFGVLTPYFRSAYVHEFNNENDDLEVGIAALPGPSVRLQAESTDSHYGNFGAGVSATMSEGLSQFVDYDVVAGHDNVTIHQVTAGMRFEF